MSSTFKSLLYENGPTGGSVFEKYCDCVIGVSDKKLVCSHHKFGKLLTNGRLKSNPCFNFFVQPKNPFHIVVKNNSETGLFWLSSNGLISTSQLKDSEYAWFPSLTDDLSTPSGVNTAF